MNINDSRKLLFVLCLTLFSLSAYAVAPSVSFTFNPTSPDINETITFDPLITSSLKVSNIQWQFDTDGNTNYFLLPNPIIDDNFNVDFTGWTPAGSFDLNGGALQSPMGDSTIGHNITYSDSNSLNFYTRMRLVTAGRAYAAFDENQTGSPQSYNVSIEPGTFNVAFRRGSTILLSTSGAVNTYFDINVVRRFDGNFSFYVNNNYIGSIVDTNDPIDGNRVVLGYDLAGGGRGQWDSITILDELALDRNQTHSFASEGVKSVCLTAGNFDGNTTSCQNITITDQVALKIWDENTGVAISGATVTVGEVEYTSNASGIVNPSITGLSFPTTILVDKNGYADRNFYYLGSAALSIDSNIGMRSTSQAQTIAFQFFEPDDTTLLSNRVIVAKKNNTYISGRIITDASGNGVMELAPQDNEYTFEIYDEGIDFGSANVDYNYLTVTVTVNQPKNEATNADINSPSGFNLQVGGLGQQTFTNLNSFPFSGIVIIGNVNDAYNLSVVDSNADGFQYFSRNYILQTKGSDNTLTIQPYLIDIDDGILVNISVKNILNNITIPNIRVQMSTSIGGTNTVVEDRLTDSAGVSQVVMLAQKNYNFLVSNPNQTIFYFDGYQVLTASSQNFTFWIIYTDSTFTITQENTTIFISPTTTILTNSPQVIDVNIDTNTSFDIIYVQAFDSNTLVDQNNCSSSPCNVKITLDFATFDSNFLNIRMTIQNGDFNYTKTYNYILSSFTNGIVNRIANLKNELGAVPLALIMFIVVFAVIGFLGGNPLGNNMAQIFLIMIIFGAFYWLWFLESNLFVGFLAGSFGVMLLYFWSRQKGGP